MSKLKKVQNYLDSRAGNYSVLDKILSFYASGEFDSFLKSHNATEIKFSPSLKDFNHSLKVCFKHGNLSAVLEFGETYCAYSVYKLKCSREELENSKIREKYVDFDIEIFLESLFQTNDLDVGVYKDENADRKKKKDLYTILFVVSTFLPWFAFGILAMCGVQIIYALLGVGVLFLLSIIVICICLFKLGSIR